ncbi:basic secretory protein-like protein [Nocardioides rubriscoriae]|uniref:basic secretory protein-like protein n=1 Tax=Nocardioides rubriscoriae TaxID=642762 RepID=UPI00147890E9|nr:basic secretory protein-like protein [Nocardioides rubriscoriae]
MSTRPSGVLALGLTLSLVLGGCGGPGSSPAPADAPGRSPAAAPGSSPGAPPGTATAPTDAPALPRVSLDLSGDLQRVLDTRAAAVLAGDRAAFLRGLTRSPGLRVTEGGYFDNLAQLPVSVFSYRLVPSSLVRTGDAYSAVVEVTLQLTPYDVTPVRTIDRFRFVPAGATSYRISSTTDTRWEAAHLGVQQPWDTEPVRVREGLGVLGVFDTADRREAAGIVASVERGVTDVAARVPYSEWGSRAVVYVLSDPRFLAGFDDLPGGDPEALDGVAFTVPGRDDGTIASTRFALSPDLLPAVSARRVDPEVDRLVRHELVHVALAEHDDAAPVWLREGLAEWVSVQALPPDRRDVPDRALAAAADIDEMPSDASFNDDDAAVHYALAWWVCEWLAQTYGPDAPWTVLDTFATRAGDDPRDVVRDLLGLSVDQLARRGAALMASTYAAPTPAPNQVPSTPSSDATDEG